MTLHKRGRRYPYYACPGDSVGASSAICGLAGALLVYMQRHNNLLEEEGKSFQKSLMVSVGATAVIGLMCASKVDNWGHVGGLLAGAAISFAVGPNLVVVDDDTVETNDTGQRVLRSVENRPLLQTYMLKLALRKGLVVKKESRS